MRRLASEDRIMLLGDEAWPQDIGVLAIMAAGPLLDAHGHVRRGLVEQAVAARLHLLPRFRQVLSRPPPGLGGPLWVDAEGFDVRHHVRVAPVAPPGDDAALLRTVEELRCRPLDPSRPLWELWLLPGLADARLGLYVRIHHVVADGMAGLATLATLLDDAADVPAGAPRPWTPRPAPGVVDLVVDHVGRLGRGLGRRLSGLVHPAAGLRRLAAAWPTLRWLLTAAPAPVTSLDRRVGPDRRLVVVRADLALVRQAAHAHGATVNDVLLAATAGGVRALLAARGERVADLVLPIYVPVALPRPPGDRRAGNLVSEMVVPLPVGLADPHQRLRRVVAETARRKAGAHPSVGSLFPAWIPSTVIMGMAARRRVNLASTNVVGPTAPRWFAGGRLLELFPLLPLVGNVTLGVGALSYAGRLGVLVVADHDAHPDLDVFAAAVAAELDALAASGASTSWDTASTPDSSQELSDGRWRPTRGA